MCGSDGELCALTVLLAAAPTCRLCAHPTRTDEEITRKGEEVWDEWWKRFLVELEVRWRVKENRYLPPDAKRG